MIDRHIFRQNSYTYENLNVMLSERPDLKGYTLSDSALLRELYNLKILKSLT